MNGRRMRGVALAVLAGALALVSGCIHIPQRAIDNGRAMSNSLEYRYFLSGDRSMRTLKGLYYRADARLLNYRQVQFPPFGHW